MTTRRFDLCTFAVLLALGCDGAEGPDPDPSQPDAAAVSSRDDIVGTFTLSLLAPSDSDRNGHTSLLGKVYDGPSPSQLVWEVAMEDADCQLFTPRAPFCPERCGASAVCVEDGVCQDYPTPQSAGTVRVMGVRTSTGEHEFTLEPIAHTYQPRATTKLPFPAFDEGDRIRLKASGGAVDPFELTARGIAPLELKAEKFDLTPDAPLDLAWKPATEPSASRVLVKLDISHHGGSKGVITCSFEDDGSAQLPAPLVSQLIELGVAGYPSVIATRQASGSTSTRFGQVVLTVESKVERYVSLEGLTSCTGNADCPNGQTCQADLTCN